MSEPTTATAARPPGAKAPGKKYAGLTRNQWFIVGGVFVAALAYILWKRHQASAAAASSTAPTNQGSNACTDANGNPVDCNELFAQELAALQNSVDQLGAASGSGGSTSGGGGSTTGTSDGSSGTGTTVTQPSATPVTSGGGTKTAAKTAGAISGLKASSVTRTSFKASWDAAANAQGYEYIVRDLASHTQLQPARHTNSTTVTVSGLKSGTDYNFGVQALPGGSGSNIHVRTK